MPVIIGFSGSSGSGKTTLISAIVPHLQKKGYRVAVIKHDAHGHYKDVEGSDSARLVDSGADCVVVAGGRLTVRFDRQSKEPDLDKIMSGLPPVDIVLVEGYKQSDIPKIAVMLHEEHLEVLDRMQEPLIAVAAGFVLPVNRSTVPVLDLHEPVSVAAFIERSLSKQERYHPKKVLNTKDV